MADWKALVDESNALTKHGGMVLLEGPSGQTLFIE